MDKMSKKNQCPFCGSDRFEEQRTEYLYSHEGEYLLVPDTPIEVCLKCGMIYYDATVLEAIEKRFFAIQQNVEEPDRTIQIPIVTYV